MDLIDRFNAKFGRWYEGLFGSDADEIRPRDVLRKIITAMEDNRREGLDHKIYVPNRYVLQLAVADQSEREYLISFLDEDELVGVLTKFMAQHSYQTRGPLDFTISELPVDPAGGTGSKLTVLARFEKGAPEARKAPAKSTVLAARAEPVLKQGLDDDEPQTIALVARAGLAITGPDGKKRHYSLSKPQVTIGRSRRSGNDVVLDDDGMASKVHARIDWEPGRYTLYDLDSTNGVSVNGKKIEGNISLTGGDEIVIGATHIAFEEEAPGRVKTVKSETPAAASAPYLTDPDGKRHYLGSITEIGSSLTADLVFSDDGVSSRHAKIICEAEHLYYLTAITGEQETAINGRPLLPGGRALLAEGDRITVGSLNLTFRGAL